MSEERRPVLAKGPPWPSRDYWSVIGYASKGKHGRVSLYLTTGALVGIAWKPTVAARGVAAADVCRPATMEEIASRYR